MHKYKCEICGETFKKSGAIRLHKRAHRPTINHCPMCNNIVQDRLWKRHLMEHIM